MFSALRRGGVVYPRLFLEPYLMENDLSSVERTTHLRPWSMGRLVLVWRLRMGHHCPYIGSFQRHRFYAASTSSTENMFWLLVDDVREVVK